MARNVQKCKDSFSHWKIQYVFFFIKIFRKNIPDITVLLLMMSYERKQCQFRCLFSSSRSPVEVDRATLTRYFGPEIAGDIFQVHRWFSIKTVGQQIILVCDEFLPAGNTWARLDCHDSHLPLLQRGNAYEEAGKEAVKHSTVFVKYLIIYLQTIANCK